MTKVETSFKAMQEKQLRENAGPDLVMILTWIAKYWYWFILSLLVVLASTRVYIRHTLPIYLTSATVLVNETEDRPLVDNTEILQGLGLPGGMKNLQNQIMIVKSRALTESTLNELPFETEFYFKTIRNKLPIYPEMPIKIVSDNTIPLPRDIEFSIEFLGDSLFNLQCEVDLVQFHTTASFNQDIKFQNGNFKIVCTDEAWLNKYKDRKLYFTIHSRIKLVNSFIKRLNVELLSREGSMLRISLQGTNRIKDADFLNKQLEGFMAISLNKKNTEAQRRIQFIDDQLIGISDSLIITENRLQQFRSTHRVMDLSAQGQAIIAQVTLLENEKARLDLEANYYEYLADYLNKDVSGEIPLVPITMGITDPALTRLVEELAELQGQLSIRGAGELNPLQRNLELRIRATKGSLTETLNGLKRANSLARSENQSQINRANSQASSLPVTERQLLGIERKFQLNNEIYTFLLETRAEQEMQKASNRADSEMIDTADPRFSTIVSPNKIVLYLAALFGGLAIPLVLIYLKYILNKKLKDEDIRRTTNVPIVGNIPRSTQKTNTIVFDDPNSSIAEAFRLLRSRMQFFIKEEKAPVLLITSTMPEDGKTFTAINLASVYSLLGKRTVLVGFDLRKPKIYQDFNLTNERGISTWLIGKDSIKDIVQQTSFDNLWVIAAGPIPPNPSELTALGKTEELLRLLREKFDFIIIDSSPIGIVSDTYYLASLSDVCLLVVRPDKTIRDLYYSTLNEIISNNIKGVSIIINDIRLDKKHYGYGEKYGYTNKKKGIKNIQT